MRNKKLLSWVLMLVLVLAAIGLTPSTAFAYSSVSIYVDTVNGNDSNDGLSTDSAVKTLGKAFLLVKLAGQSYDIIMANGDYASPGLVNIPAGASVSVTAADSEGNVKIYINPDTPTVNRIIEFNASAFLSVSFENIAFTGDNPVTTESIEKSGEGIYLYSCDRVGGNTIEFKSCVFENLEYGINQEYSESLSTIVRDSDIAAKHPISMDYGISLTVDNSVLEMPEGEYWSSVIDLNGGSIAVQITNNTLIGNNGAGRGIYEDAYSGTISGNIFKDLDIAIEADVHSLVVSDNIIETSKNGLDLEVEDTNFSVSVINNTIVNKGLKTSGKEGISLYNDDDYITAGTFVVQDNKIINFYTGLDYYDSTDAVISFTLGGTGHGNSFWGNVINVDWNPDWADDAITKLDATVNDWGTTDKAEALARIYADGRNPSDVFIFDDTILTSMIDTAYVDDNYTQGNADGHTYGVDAFSSIMEAQPYVMPGGQIQVADGSYIAPAWLDRPVHIIGLGDNVNISKHYSLTEYGNATTTVTAPGVTIEKLNYRNGDNGIKFDQFSMPPYSYSSYPDYYKILDCSFTNFTQTAIYDPGLTLFDYVTVPDSTSEIRNNIFTRSTDIPNGYGVYLENKSENLYFSNNTLLGDYNYGVCLNGQNIYATGNDISVKSTYLEQAMKIIDTKNLVCTDNVLTNSEPITSNYGTVGLNLIFDNTIASCVKEVYRNHIHGFSSGAMLFGSESSEIFDITIGGINSNANDFSDNEFGLTSLLSNFNSEPTNATYNIWGRTDDLLSGYIKGSHYSADYQPVAYLPTASMTLSDDATLSALSATGIALTPAFDSATTSYSANVSNSIISTTVSAVTYDNSATVTINGTEGSSKAVSLNVGSNLITVKVTAEDGVTSKTYTINITRESYIPVENQAPVLTSDWNYTSVYFGQEYPFTITVTDYENSPNTRLYSYIDDASPSQSYNFVLVPGTVNISLAPIKGILSAGSHTLNYYAVDSGGAVSSVLVLPFTILEQTSSESSLSSISLTNINLIPAFNSETLNYAASVSNSISSTTVTAIAVSETATIKINGISGNSKTMPLNVGSNLITVVVTDEDGVISKTYTINISREDSSSGGGGGSSYKYYTITAKADKEGKISPSGNISVRKGSDKEFTITTNKGYIISDLLVDGKSVGTVDNYTFEDVSKSHTIIAKFVEEIKEELKEPESSDKKIPFIDISLNDWFVNDVMWAYENGIMNGTSNTTFNPHGITTRGMIVTILYRLEGLEGSPATEANAFIDVEAGKYYANAVAWAANNKIVKGYGNGKFGPEDAITREQLATILVNYAKLKGYDVSSKADLSKFEDSAEASNWAEDALSWASFEKLIQGDGNKLLPKGIAERSQTVAILHRFVDNIINSSN